MEQRSLLPLHHPDLFPINFPAHAVPVSSPHLYCILLLFALSFATVCALLSSIHLVFALWFVKLRCFLVFWIFAYSLMAIVCQYGTDFLFMTLRLFSNDTSVLNFTWSPVHLCLFPHQKRYVTQPTLPTTSLNYSPLAGDTGQYMHVQQN